MICREEGEIRILREDGHARVNAGIFIVATLAIAFITLVYPARGRFTYGLPVTTLFVVITIGIWRAHDVLIIRPDEIGMGAMPNKIRWFDRTQIGHAWVRKDLLLVAHLYDSHSEVVGVKSYRYFKAAELRTAFAEAGIPEHRPERLPGRRKH